MGRADGSLLVRWIQCGRRIVLEHRGMIASARDIGSEMSWNRGPFPPKDSLFTMHEAHHTFRGACTLGQE